MVSEWNQWLVPAPIRIMQRPRDFSAVRANSRAIFTAFAAGTEVCVSCHAGVPGCEASSYPVGQLPGRPGRATPYCASSRSKTVVTSGPSGPPSRVAGTPRRSTSPRPWPCAPPSVSKRGRSTSTPAATASPCRESWGTTGPSARFHFPLPDSVQRKPSEPFGTAARPVASSRTTVFHSAPSPVSPRTEARRNLAGTSAPSRSARVTRNGRSV